MRNRQRKQYYKKPKPIKVTVARCMKYMKPVMSNESCKDFDPISTLNVQKQCVFCKYKS